MNWLIARFLAALLTLCALALVGYLAGRAASLPVVGLVVGEAS